MEGGPRFVGRRGELSRFKRALAGEVRLLLVVGDAGVGKTRFVTEALDAVAGDSVTAVWGNCLPLAEKLPLLPVVQALGDLSRHEGGRVLAEALGSVPAYARLEMTRLLPGLNAHELGGGNGGSAPDGGGEAGGWQRDRLFSAVAEVLSAVAVRSPVCLVIEDVHWADAATLDCLTYLLRARDVGAVTLVATCRSDEAPLDELVMSWLAHVRGSGAVAEIRLGPLSRPEVGDQIAALAGGPVPGMLADDVFARAEGNPFFTEQLVAAALTDDDPDGDASGLPARLAELLLTRSGRCGQHGQAVLAALSVAGRPLDEAALSEVTGRDQEAVRRGLRELAAARLLADPALGRRSGTSRPRHALLAEAVAGALLPGERAALHERTAAMLESAGDDMLAAEAAGHWLAAGRPGRELPARVTAGQAAERVFAYAEAAAHFQRAIDLYRDLPVTSPRETEVPMLYVRAIDALMVTSDGERADALAQEAHARFGGHPDPDTAAAVITRMAYYRVKSQPEAALELLREAIGLVSDGPPSAVQAEAWHRYGLVFLETGAGNEEDSRAALERAAEIGAAAGAAALVPRSLLQLFLLAWLRGDVEGQLALLGRARELAEACGDGESLLVIARHEGVMHYTAGHMEAALQAELAGLRTARRLGRQDSMEAVALLCDACDELYDRGRTAEAGALIDHLTSGPPDVQHLYLHLCRAEVDLRRGDLEAAELRFRQVQAMTAGQVGGFRAEDTIPLLAADLALWTGRPGEALAAVTRELPSLSLPIMWLAASMLIAGMRACADLAETARARRDDAAEADALAAAGDLVSWVDRLAVPPFADRPADVYPPVWRAAWQAERTRLTGDTDPGAWAAAAEAWAGIEHVHRAAYAWWRQAQALLHAGRPATAAAAVLRAAAKAAQGHAPLLAEVSALAERARIDLNEPAAAVPDPGQATAMAPDPYGLTDRELSVLGLLARGLTNAQIGAELYMSPKTASVHISSIFRKLGVSGRTQAAAVAERAGLLGDRQL